MLFIGRRCIDLGVVARDGHGREELSKAKNAEWGKKCYGMTSTLDGDNQSGTRSVTDCQVELL